MKCDFCGAEFKKHDVENGWFNTITIKTTFGSKFDLNKFVGEICDDCIEKLFLGKLQKVEINTF